VGSVVNSDGTLYDAQGGSGGSFGDSGRFVLSSNARATSSPTIR
jgi:hypothetical protein